MLKQPIQTAVIPVLVMLSAAFPTAVKAQTNHVSRPIKAGYLFGKRVENPDGIELGTVRNLILDTRTGRMKYVILGSGGFLGVGTKLKVVPPDVMSAATAKRETLAIGITRERWRQAPAFGTSQIAALAQPDRTRQIASFYDQAANDVRFAGITTHRSSSANELTATGAKTGAPASSADLIFASDLIGKRIINRDGEKIGEVLDVLVSFDDRPGFAIVSSARMFRRGEQRYAIPLRAFGKSDDGEKLLLNADRSTLQKSPLFGPSVWESGGENKIYRYGEDPHTATNFLPQFFKQRSQQTKEMDKYGKMQFIGESPAQRAARSV